MNDRSRMFSSIMTAGFIVAAAGLAGAADKKVDISQVPEPVKATIDANSKGETITEIELEDEDGRQIYSVEFARKDGKERELEIAPDGELLKVETVAADNGDDDDSESTETATDKVADDGDNDEVKIDPASAPEVVRSAITPLLRGAELKAMARETEDGKTVYEAEYVADGQEHYVEVSAEGKVLEIDKTVAVESLPAAVRGAVKERMPNGEIQKAGHVERRDGESPSMYYELMVQDGEKMLEVKVDEAGKVLEVEEDED